MPKQPMVEHPSLAESANLAGTAPDGGRGQHAGLTGPWLPAAAIIAATILAYLPSLSNGFIWDDDEYVTDNRNLQSWPGLLATWARPTASPQYYPLVFTTFWIEYYLWGLHPLGYHLVNVLLHAASAVLLWQLLRHLGVAGAFLAGLVFAIHPVYVESVAWITERKNVLSGLLYLLAVAAYLRFDPLQGNRRRWGFYALAAVLFAGALLSKTVTCTLPAALGLILWWKRPKLSIRDLWPLVPLLAVGAAMGLMTAWFEKEHVRAEGEEWNFSLAQRMLIAGQALWFYASKLLWPHPLSFIYPRWNIDQAARWQYIFPISAAGVMVALVLLRRRIGKGPAAGVLFFAGTMFPALGFFAVYAMRFSFVADHWQYLAGIGLIALGCAALWRLGQRLGRPGRRGVVVLAAAAVIALAATTWRRTTAYRNAEQIWQDTLTKNFDCWVAHTNLGEIYNQAADLAKAAGNTVTARAELDKAIFHDAHALRVASDFPELLFNLGLDYVQLGRFDEAIKLFRRAMNLKPRLPSRHFEVGLHYNLGMALVGAGHMDESVEHFRRVIRLDPNMVEAYVHLSMVLARGGQFQEAAKLCRQAVSIRPDLFEPRRNLGAILEVTGDYEGAAESYRAALAIAPTDGQTYLRLAFVLARMGKAEPAMAAFNESIRLTGPNDRAAEALRRILKDTPGAQTQGTAK
jgi:tetratricopeptide (TPR) repeat protein